MGIENQVDKRRSQSLEESIITEDTESRECLKHTFENYSVSSVSSVVIALPMFFHHSDV